MLLVGSNWKLTGIQPELSVHLGARFLLARDHIEVVFDPLLLKVW